MGIAIRQQTTWVRDTNDAAFPSDILTGSYIVVLVASRNRDYTVVPTATAGRSLTFVVDLTGVETATNVARDTVYCSNAPSTSAGPCTITLTHGFGDERSYVALEVTGAETTPLDKAPAVASDTNWGTGNCTATSTGALSQANEVAFSVINGRSSAAFSSLTTPSGWTDLGTYLGGAGTNDSPVSFAYLITSATTALAPVWGTSGSGVFSAAVLVITYKEASAGGLVVNPLSGRGGTMAQPLVN